VPERGRAEYLNDRKPDRDYSIPTPKINFAKIMLSLKQLADYTSPQAARNATI
jgi:hypothetical protein